MPYVRRVTITNAKVIHYGTFYGVTSLQTVMVNDVLTAIEPYAFYNTTSLAGVRGDLTELVSIGESAFENSSISMFNADVNC